jgi:hypothetical protein
MPTPEICNGLDDDCNDVADNGCPISVALNNGGFRMHVQFGSLTGTNAFSNVCAAGSAIYRFSGNLGDNVDRIEAHCASLTLAVDTMSMPYAYSITRSNDFPLGINGQNATTAFDVACPANQFVVGIDGEAGVGGVQDVNIHCAELLVRGTPGSFAVSYGTVTTMPIDGSTTDTAYSDLLAAPKAVERYRGRSSASPGSRPQFRDRARAQSEQPVQRAEAPETGCQWDESN